jgi:hypothetical protein
MMQQLKNQRSWIFIISSGLVSLMMACFSISVIQVLGILPVSFDATYLGFFSVLVSLESIGSYRWLQGKPPGSTHVLTYRISEWVILLLILKLASGLRDGFSTFFEELLSWQREFISTFITTEFLFSLLLMAIVWIISLLYAESLTRMDADDRTIRLDLDTGFVNARTEARTRIADLILVVGAAMVIVTSFQFVFSQLTSKIIVRPGSAAFLFVYFMFGLLLLCFTQYSIMRIRWILLDSPVRKDITKRWIFSSIIFIFGIAVISNILPTGYSIGLLGVMQGILRIIINIITIVVSLIVFPFLAIFHWITSLLPVNPTPPARLVIPPMDLLPSTPGRDLVWLEFIKSTVFWLFLILLVIFSIVYFLREHKQWLGDLRIIPLISGIFNFISKIRNWFVGVNQHVIEAIKVGINRFLHTQRGDNDGFNFRRVGMNRLNYRQKLFFYYLRMIQRGQEAGFPRKGHQSPTEYANLLVERLKIAEQFRALPDDVTAEQMETEIDSLTQAFNEARYTQHSISSVQVENAGKNWRKIRRFLKPKAEVK